MTETSKQYGQFKVLMTGDPTISCSLTQHHGQSIVSTNERNDILLLVETAQFDLILLDLTVNHPEYIARIKDPQCINNKTPVIAIIDAGLDCSFQPVLPLTEGQCPIEFDDWLVSPITAGQVNEIIDIWQAKALAYIPIIMNKTKNNRALALTIFGRLFEELPQQITQIKDALKDKQYGLAKEITHKLNGSVSFCGLLDIQQSAHALEGCLLSSQYADADRLFSVLQRCTRYLIRHQATILANLENDDVRHP